MKKYVSTLLLTLSALAITTIFMPAKADITVASYNLTHANKNDGKSREDGNSDVIKQLKADIYGLQEVIEANNQLKSIEKTLPSYKYIGKPRSSGKDQSFWQRTVMFFAPLNNRLICLGAEDEYNPIFYNPKTVELITSETFGINGDGSGFLPRICTVGQFKEKITNKDFYVYNTHLDHKQEKSRIMQLKIINNDIAQRCGTTPVILMGDLNNAYAGELQKILSDAGFALAKKIAATIEGPEETHEKGSTKKLTTIDHIVVEPKKAFNIKYYRTLSTMSKKTSDHNPVSMTFSLN